MRISTAPAGDARAALDRRRDDAPAGFGGDVGLFVGRSEPVTRRKRSMGWLSTVATSNGDGGRLGERGSARAFAPPQAAERQRRMARRR